MTSNKKIKILFRHRSMEMGGVEKVLLSIVNNLNRDLFDITVCLNLNQGELRDEFPSDVRKVPLTKGKEDMSKNPLIQKLQLLKRSRQLKSYAKKPGVVDKKILGEKYDIEVAMTYNDFEMVLQSTNKKSKKIAWFHSEVTTPKFKPILPKVTNNFPKFDKVIYCSQRIYDVMHTAFPDLNYPEEDIIVNAIPTEEIREKAKEKIPKITHAKTFISVGRLHNRKGYHLLLEVHKRLLDEGLLHEIIILGDGEEKENLLKKISELKVEKTFHLLGNKMNPYPYIAQSNFFILPSRSEAWPLVIAEALLLKKPTIGTNVGDVAKIIRHNETGLVIDQNIDEIYEAMKSFLTDDTLIEKLRNNLETIDQQFDNQRIFDKIEKTFIDILK